MSLAHLPAEEILHHGVAFSIQLGFRVVQDMGKLSCTVPIISRFVVHNIITNYCMMLVNFFLLLLIIIL